MSWWVAREVSATLCLQPGIISLGLRVYLWLFETSAILWCGGRFSRLEPEKRRHWVEHCRLPLWDLVRKLLRTLVVVSIFDYPMGRELSHERKSA